VKPAMAVCTLSILSVAGESVGWWGTTSSVIYNLSYTIALYGLVSAPPRTSLKFGSHDTCPAVAPGAVLHGHQVVSEAVQARQEIHCCAFVLRGPLTAGVVSCRLPSPSLVVSLRMSRR
jgi:hypothetical protein